MRFLSCFQELRKLSVLPGVKLLSILAFVSLAG